MKRSKNDPGRRHRYETAYILGMGYGLLLPDDHVHRLSKEIECVVTVQIARKELSTEGSFLMDVREDVLVLEYKKYKGEKPRPNSRSIQG